MPLWRTLYVCLCSWPAIYFHFRLIVYSTNQISVCCLLIYVIFFMIIASHDGYVYNYFLLRICQKTSDTIVDFVQIIGIFDDLFYSLIASSSTFFVRELLLNYWACFKNNILVSCVLLAWFNRVPFADTDIDLLAVFHFFFSFISISI